MAPREPYYIDVTGNLLIDARAFQSGSGRPEKTFHWSSSVKWFNYFSSAHSEFESLRELKQTDKKAKLDLTEHFSFKVELWFPVQKKEEIIWLQQG